MTYEEAVAYVSGLAPRGWRLGLDRMREFARRAGLDGALGPHPRYVHVAGTNGKGSVTAFVESILFEAGSKVGSYYSPFVYDIRERIQVGRRMVSRESFAELVERLRPIAESFDGGPYGPISEFEFKTAMGFTHWRDCGCEWVALEVGLGGRLDATNIVDPASAVVVSIGLDHVDILGGTLESIAFEKAGVAKPGRPLIVGDLPPSALETVLRQADAVGSPAWVFGREVRLHRDGELWTVSVPGRTVTGLCPGIEGAAQPHNMALAVAAVLAAGAQLPDDAIRLGAATTSLPGRFERRQIAGHTVVLDGAHNAEAASVLARSMLRAFPGVRVPMVAGSVRGHDPVGVFRELSPCVERVFACPLEFARALQPHAVAEAAERAGVAAEPCASVGEAVARAVHAAGPGRPVLVSGSFYLLGEAARALARL
ncbi:MAG: bifunctional folylpolyglutamate synthase/dihydrofolate synthase [Fimbriimonadales bacterium]|nr:bifunctional folylpolyglutamate synthase/dihydrofolate synthase [Fimbriimonadales bacterium]